MATADNAPSQRSPFEGHAPGERPTGDGSIGVRLNAGTLRGVILIGTWPTGRQTLCGALGAALACAVPDRTGALARTESGLLLRTGPEEFLLLSAQDQDHAAALRANIAADIGSVTDLSHARCLVRIEGDRCVDALAKLLALDFRAQSFPAGEFRLTGHHHVPCLLHRLSADQFDMLVFTTYAFDQLSTLLDASLEFGVALRLD